MDFNKLTEKVQDSLRAAQSIATKNSHQQVDVEHLLLALLEQENGLATSLVRRAGADPCGERFGEHLFHPLPRLSCRPRPLLAGVSGHRGRRGAGVAKRAG